MLVENVITRLALAALGKTPEIDMVPSRDHAARNPVSICGWLHKMKRKHRAFTPAWVHRWFTIENGRLAWYPNKTTEHMNGYIDLSTVVGVREFEEGGEGVYSLVVRSTERTLLLRAQNKRDMERWANNIRLQIQCIKEGANLAMPGTTRRQSASSAPMDQFDLVLDKLETALQQIEKIEDEFSLGSEPDLLLSSKARQGSRNDSSLGAKWEVASSSTSSGDEDNEEGQHEEEAVAAAAAKESYRRNEDSYRSSNEVSSGSTATTAAAAAMPKPTPPPKPMRKESSTNDSRRLSSSFGRDQEEERGEEKEGESVGKKRSMPPPKPLPPNGSGQLVRPRPQPPKGSTTVRRYESKELHGREDS